MTTCDVFGNQSFLGIPIISSRQGLGGWVPDRAGVSTTSLRRGPRPEARR